MIWSFSPLGQGDAGQDASRSRVLDCSPLATSVSRPLPRSGWLAGVVLALVLSVPATAAAQDESNQCRVLELDTTPSEQLQIVIWLEDADGNFIDTLYITRLTGSYGLGNRPGLTEFNSAWRWPYGRRIQTFPVWSHRHGLQWPLVIFQNLDDSNLSHPFGESSRESFYCRPLRVGESQWDTQTCSSTVFTDKGVLSATETSRYPPRRDLEFDAGSDDDSVKIFRELNPFDAVSRPTPQADLPFRFIWPVPKDLPQGNYVVWMEVSEEFDHNEHYSIENYPSPDVRWSDYGLPGRGQPAVVYKVPFVIDDADEESSVAEYFGYGDPDGIDGMVREPDVTITTGVEGSGASRLLLDASGEVPFRVRVRSRPSPDKASPGAPYQLEIIAVNSRSMEATFLAPGDDDMEGRVAGYEIRYLIAETITEKNWPRATLAATSIGPVEPGQLQEMLVTELVPRTRYSIAVRAYDECRNLGPLAVTEVVTAEREIGEVGWCFIATAAYGSSMASELDMLRRFRDRYLRTHATGELAVESYYTFGPALAKMVGSSDTLRRAVRAGLAPVVDAVRDMSPSQ